MAASDDNMAVSGSDNMAASGSDNMAASGSDNMAVVADISAVDRETGLLSR